MKISGHDAITDKAVTLTASVTTDHPASSYGLPVMLIEEWGGACMSYFDFILIGGKITEIKPAELPVVEQWVSLLEAMTQ